MPRAATEPCHLVDGRRKSTMMSVDAAQAVIVEELAIAPVKGCRLVTPGSVEVTEFGVVDDRRFIVVAEQDRLLDARRGALSAVEVEWDPEREWLSLTTAGGTAQGPIETGGALQALVTWDGNRPLSGRQVHGPWDSLLSDHLEQPVRLAEVDAPGSGIDVAPLTVVSTASIARLEEEMKTSGLGSRRFRMTLTLSGLGAHEEDVWEGRRIEVGGCRLRVGGAVSRCVVITHDPETGERDHPALKGLVGYRPRRVDADGTVVKVPFGVYAWVERAGTIAAGDSVDSLG